MKAMWRSEAGCRVEGQRVHPYFCSVENFITCSETKQNCSLFLGQQSLCSQGIISLTPHLQDRRFQSQCANEWRASRAFLGSTRQLCQFQAWGLISSRLSNTLIPCVPRFSGKNLSSLAARHNISASICDGDKQRRNRTESSGLNPVAHNHQQA